MKCLLSCVRAFAAVVLLAIGAAAGAQPPPPEVTVRTSLDRTAIWVADRVTYTVEVNCPRGVELLADDLSRDKLQLEGLEAIQGDVERRSASDGATVYRFRYLLTTYRVDTPTLTIGPLRARYAVRRAGQRLEDAAPAGEVQVPGVVIAFRSVVPDGQDPPGLRADKPPDQRPARFALLQPIGIGLVIVSAIPAVLAIAALVRRRRPRLRRPARVVRRDERAALDALRAMNVNTVDERRDVCTQLDTLVRDHLREVCGIPGASLTPPEVAAALAARAAKVPAELVTSVLATCELARYAPPQAMPSADSCRRAVEQVEQVISRS